MNQKQENQAKNLWSQMEKAESLIFNIRNQIYGGMSETKYHIGIQVGDNVSGQLRSFELDPQQMLKLQSNKEIFKADIKSKNIKLYKKPLRVYLAGKIKQNGWRELIVGYRCNHLYGGDNVDLTKYTVKYNDQITITGPWFLSCDHGCYHGDNTHGLGINKMGCPDANGDNYLESEVYDICTQQIMGSDIVFAYIDDNTCYGSLYEIGLAKALGKKIIIVFDNGERMSDMWFICQGADITEHMSILDKQKHITIKDKFDEIINKLQTK